MIAVRARDDDLEVVDVAVNAAHVSLLGLSGWLCPWWGRPLIGGFMASFLKFGGIFAITQIPLAISEGLLTVLIFNALARFNPRELRDMNLLDVKGAKA